MSRRTFLISGALVAGATALPISRPLTSMASADGSWLADSVMYQIYPQTFADSDGSGVGDLQGIIDHLDHLQWLGITAVWMNPIFSSPLTDAGYDVSDYVGVHERYGTQDDVVRLVDEARRRGIRILFDLVAGHTSDQHPWFLNSLNDPADDRFVWATPDQFPNGELPENFVASPGPREGAFLKNFYDTQPAINYGYARMNPDEPWRQPIDAEGPKRNREAMREVMDHWLRLGISGFRCDMAGSLIKDDPGLVETGGLWVRWRPGSTTTTPTRCWSRSGATRRSRFRPVSTATSSSRPARHGGRCGRTTPTSAPTAPARRRSSSTPGARPRTPSADPGE
ncbi:alpha-amylase family glycosyl hydrolase [Saccharopolyspora sp. ID03-671]|uniref:alpha-amylase family glycosyl hydrolase n=1 Tax=Saccharopolyspora sp. ID03-671 TaxID=3073066 RepID=UPI0032531AAC